MVLPCSARYQRAMRKRFLWLVPAGLVLGLILGAAAAAVIGYLLPRQFESSAIVQVRPVIEAVGTLPEHKAVRNPPGSLPAAMELMTSEELLRQVAEDLDLATRWAIEEPAAIRRLRSMLSTDNIRGTDLIEVRVRASSPQDSMQVANQVVEEFVRIRGAGQAESSRLDEVPQEMPQRVSEPGAIVHAEAMPPSRSAAPSTWLLLLAGAGAGGMLGILGGLVAMPVLRSLTQARAS